MAKNTTNYGFIKPDDDDFYDIQLENANWDKADNELKKLSTEKVDKVSGKQLSTNDYSNAEKTKLAGVATNANNYTHPSTHPASVTVQDATHRFVTDAEKTAWNGKVTASGGDISNTRINSFDASTAELPVPAAGDTAKAFSGKIKKFFEDIKAWKPNVLLKSMVVNNFTTTAAGMVADARAIKTLHDGVTQLNQDLGDYYSLQGGTKIPTNANLYSDTYKVPGNYYCKLSSDAKTYTNCPFSNAFKLIVDMSNGVAYPRQTFLEYHTNRVFRRTYDDLQNAWIGEVSYITSSDLAVSVEQLAGTVTSGNATIYSMSACRYGHVVALLIQIKTSKTISAGGNISITLDKSLNSQQACNLVGYSGAIAIIGVTANNTINFRVLNQLEPGITFGATGCFIST